MVPRKINTVRVLLVPFINFHHNTTVKMIIVIIIKLHGALKNKLLTFFQVVDIFSPFKIMTGLFVI